MTKGRSVFTARRRCTQRFCGLRPAGAGGHVTGRGHVFCLSLSPLDYRKELMSHRPGCWEDCSQRSTADSKD